MKTAEGGSIAPNFPKGVFRKFGAIDPLHFQTMKTAKSGSIAPNFPNGVVAENLVLSNRCISENQDSEGRFDSTKFSEGCHRTAAFCKIWTAKRSEGRFDSTKFSEGRFQKIWCYRTAAFSDNEDSEGRFDSTKYSEGCFLKTPFGKFGAIEPPLTTQRFDSTKFSENALRKIWCYRTALRCASLSKFCKMQRFDDTLRKIWCYRTALRCFSFWKVRGYIFA